MPTPHDNSDLQHPRPGRRKGKGMTDEEIIQGILEGCSLRTFMVPDPAMPNNHPEHIESYDLPHVIINGGTFWGKTENGHLAHILGEAPMDLNAYCYSNMEGVFCAFCLEDGSAALMRKDRYKTHEWRLIRNYKLIWDSDGDRSTETIASEIEAYAKFKIAMLDSEGIWNVHPVDLPMYETKSGRFQLKTVRDGYPMFFRLESLPDGMIEKVQGIDRASVAYFHPTIFECFYSVFSDGTYYNFYDIPRNTRQEYQRLLVFTDTP